MPIRSKYFVPHSRAARSFFLLGSATSAWFGSGVGGEAVCGVLSAGGTRALFESGLGSALGAGFFCSVLPITGSVFGKSRRVGCGAGSGSGTALSKVGACAGSTGGTDFSGTGTGGSIIVAEDAGFCSIVGSTASSRTNAGGGCERDPQKSKNDRSVKCAGETDGRSG